MTQQDQQTDQTEQTEQSQEQDVSSRTKVWVLLDRSGSMSGLEEAVVAGTNEFLSTQRDGPGRCRLTLAQFDSQDPFAVFVNAKKIGNVSELTAHDYQPRGTTPLYDAIGSLIEAADARRKSRKRRGKAEEDQVVVVYTDGLENASRRYDRAKIFERIQKRQAKGWAFVFLGANQDSYAIGQGLGIDPRGVQNWGATPEGARAAHTSVGRGLRRRRAMSRYAAKELRADFFDGLREAEEQLQSEARDQDEESEGRQAPPQRSSRPPTPAS